MARGTVRQRGIQEIDGVAIAASICVVAEHLEAPISRAAFAAAIERGRTGRKGPVFLEMCLDAQGAPIDRVALESESPRFEPEGAFASFVQTARQEAGEIAARIRAAKRPIVLLGGGVSRAAAAVISPTLERAGLPVMTTWNGMDRVDAGAANFFGRPNQWGQRFANVLIQQAELVVAVGTRLGMQQTGFNWQEFAAGATIVQVEIDEAELAKGHPRVDVPLLADADAFLRALLDEPLGEHAEWLAYGQSVRQALPLRDPRNVTAPGYLDPYRFVEELAARCQLATTSSSLARAAGPSPR